MDKIYAIFDEKAQAFIPLWQCPNHQMATRSFGDLVNDPNHHIGAHPQDYTLWCLGEVDPTTGNIHTLNEVEKPYPEVVASGPSVRIQQIDPNLPAEVQEHLPLTTQGAH